MIGRSIRFAACLALVGLFGCQSGSKPEPKAPTASKTTEVHEQKIAVLLVNHGSHSKTWRKALLDLEEKVEPALLKNVHISDVRTAFMEYNEPSIATRLREYDQEGVTDVVLVPIFLTVSPHSFDDIPTIIGQKKDPESFELLKLERIEQYTPKAKVHITPLLDFTDVLTKNILRRVKTLSTQPESEGLVLIAYGDKVYEKEWAALLKRVGDHVTKKLGITEHTHGWCGHLVHYKSERTTEAVERVLAKKKTALVIPVLVAHDEMFQVKIIGGGIKAIEGSENKVKYRPDSILPDENVEQWVIDAATKEAIKIAAGAKTP